MVSTTRRALESIAGNVEESMGVRAGDLRPKLSPVPHRKDASRRPLRGYGRIAVSEVVPDPNQPRVEFSAEALGRLATSIQEKGQFHPIRVRWSNDIQKWVIINGERRWRAVRAAELETIDCYFHEGPLDDSDILEQQLVENLLREDLKPIEEARAFSSLMELNGWTGQQVAEALRVPASKVSRALALLKLPEDIQQRVEQGEISARSGYELSRLPDENARRALADKAAAGTLKHEQVANSVRQQRGKPKPSPRGTRQTFMVQGGWKVVVSANKKGTYAEIEQALCEALEEVRHRIDNNVQIF